MHKIIFLYSRNRQIKNEIFKRDTTCNSIKNNPPRDKSNKKNCYTKNYKTLVIR